MIKKKAHELGANCVLGLKVDVDEVNGKNTQLFMVTAYGTAVVATNPNFMAKFSNEREIDSESLNNKAALLRIRNSIDNNDYKLILKDLHVIVENGDPFFKEYILSKLKNLLDGKYGTVDSDTNKEAGDLYQRYFSKIPAESSIDVLYRNLMQNSDSSIITDKIISIIKENDLVDYDFVKKLLLSDSLAVKKYALRILLCDKPVYTVEDLSEINSIIDLLPKAFTPVGKISTKKSFLSSSEKEVWTCICNCSNNLNTEYCDSCTRDIYGFYANEPAPKLVVDRLKLKEATLASILTS